MYCFTTGMPLKLNIMKQNSIDKKHVTFVNVQIMFFPFTIHSFSSLAAYVLINPVQNVALGNRRVDHLKRLVYISVIPNSIDWFVKNLPVKS